MNHQVNTPSLAGQTHVKARLRIGLIGLSDKDCLVMRSFAALTEGRLPVEPEFVIDDAGAKVAAWIINIDLAAGKRFLAGRTDAPIFLEASGLEIGEVGGIGGIGGIGDRSPQRLRLPVRLAGYLEAMEDLCARIRPLAPEPVAATETSKPVETAKTGVLTGGDAGGGLAHAEDMNEARTRGLILRIYCAGDLVAVADFAHPENARECVDLGGRLAPGAAITFTATGDAPTVAELSSLSQRSDVSTLLWLLGEHLSEPPPLPAELQDGRACFRLTRWPPTNLTRESRFLMRFASLAMRPVTLDELTRRSSLDWDRVRRYCANAFFAGVAELSLAGPAALALAPAPATVPAALAEGRDRLGMVARLRTRLGI